MYRTAARRRGRSAAPLRLAATLLLCIAAAAAAAALSGSEAGAAKSGWESKVDLAVLQKAAQGPTDFLVYFRQKADLSGAASLRTKEAKGRYVYERLTAAAAASQPDVLGLLDRANAKHQPFWIVNAIYARGDLALIRAIAERAEVSAVYAPAKGRLIEPVAADRVPQSTRDTLATDSIFRDIDRVDADRVWSELGVTGADAVVAGADTGVRWDHEALKAKYRGWNAETGTVDHNYNWHDAIPYPTPGCPTADGDVPCDDNSHGTHTVGTMVGSAPGANNQFGMAPDAKWMGCRNMGNTGQSLGVIPTYLECMEWLLAPTDSNDQNPNPAKAPHVVNNSWGCLEACASPALKDQVDASRAAGIVYVASAGNEGSNCATIAAPLAVYVNAFTVGATVTNTVGGPDTMASFSSRGPVLTNPVEGVAIRKPDIVAPGNSVRSATHTTTSSYGNKSGTSMAGPHVAGLVALMISANPGLAGDVDRIEEIIEQTAVPVNSTQVCPPGTGTTDRPNNVVGYGRIDAFAAVRLAMHNDPPTAVADAAATFADEAIDVDVLANDTDPDNDALAVTAVDAPRKGTAAINPDGTVKYTPLASFLGTDGFTYTVTDDRGKSAVGTVTVTVSQSDAANAGAWLLGNEGKKVNIGFKVNETNEGLVGWLELVDKPAGATVAVDTVTSMGAVGPGCGDIADGPEAFELRGTGTFNGAPASFRWCAFDAGEPTVATEPDRFFLECTQGCSYETASRSADMAIDGGNVNVRRVDAGGAPAPGPGSPESEPSTVILAPLTLTAGVPGALQTFTVQVYDQEQQPLSNVAVTLTRTTSGGTETLRGTTGAAGLATLTLANVTGVAEYLASAGGVGSNAIEITSLVR